MLTFKNLRSIYQTKTIYQSLLQTKRSLPKLDPRHSRTFDDYVMPLPLKKT